mgnify:CR=1 FL=1
MNDLPTRCIDPVMKYCQDCTWGYRKYGDDVETYADTIGCCFESGCTLGFVNEHNDSDNHGLFTQKARQLADIINSKLEV